MTRKLFILLTGIFWLAVLSPWVESRLLPPATEHRFSLAQGAEHATAEDCWPSTR